MTTHEEQVAMDGSPATVVRTIGDLQEQGTYKGLPTSFNPAAFRKEPVIVLRFQCGPIGEVGVNGCAIEDVLEVLMQRLAGFQNGPFRCEENQAALRCLWDAKGHLEARTRARQAQRVEGTNQAHRTEAP